MMENNLENLWSQQRSMMSRVWDSLMPMYARKLHGLNGIRHLEEATLACVEGDIQQAIDKLGPTFSATMLHYMLLRLTYEASKIETGARRN